jgi:hypothetical protein
MRAIFEKYPAFKPEQMLKFTDMAPIEPEVEEETKVAETKIDIIQKQIDAMELQIAEYRKANKDFDSTPIEVAEKLGTRQKFEKLLKQRDELMWRGNPIKNLSADTMKMVRAGEGFRCESYGGSGSRIPSEVVRFEYEELNNDMTDQMIEALNLPTKLTPEQVFGQIKQEYDDKYDAVWLATEEETREHYCDGDEPEGYIIPPDAIVLQDLGNDGALFLLPKQRKNPATPFTATWPSEPSHGSPPPPQNIPPEWFDRGGKTILPKYEDEFMDLLIYKFWNSEEYITEGVTTNGAFPADRDKSWTSWQDWKGEYSLGISHNKGTLNLEHGPETIERSIKIEGVPIVTRVTQTQLVAGQKAGDPQEDRLYFSADFKLIGNRGRHGWIPEDTMMPDAIALDKIHFIIRKTLVKGREKFPVLQWVEVDTFISPGGEMSTKLVATKPINDPDGYPVRLLQYPVRAIPDVGYNWHIGILDKGLERDVLYINLLKPFPEETATPAIDHLTEEHEIIEELNRIFKIILQVDVAEIPVEPTAIADIQERVDDIEREIRILRVKEKDFNSSNDAVAARLGKQEEYDKLMRERDEAMWRGNPEHAEFQITREW